MCDGERTLGLTKISILIYYNTTKDYYTFLKRYYINFFIFQIMSCNIKFVKSYMNPILESQFYLNSKSYIRKF